jgi:ribonuclease BN (tRNA processing enzyme)
MAQAELHFLGSGNAFHQDGRGSQCILIRPSAGGPFLVDLGPTAMAAAMRYEVDVSALERVFFTHLHGDHTAGWPFLLLHFNFIDRRTRPFEVNGPEGLRRCLEGLMSLCYQDVLEHPKLGFEIRYREVPVAEADGMMAGETRFAVVPMEHHASSLGFRFEVDGRWVGVTGDTQWCEGLERLARASDLLVVECTSVEPHAHAHLSLEEIRAGRDRLGGCELVLNHLTDQVATQLAADPIPGVTASYDGMVYPF